MGLDGTNFFYPFSSLLEFGVHWASVIWLEPKFEYPDSSELEKKWDSASNIAEYFQLSLIGSKSVYSQVKEYINIYCILEHEVSTI